MTQEDLLKMLASGQIGAVAIDTNVFDEEGQDIDDGNLPLLRQIEQAGKRLLIPDVIAREMEKHLRDKYVQEKAFDGKVLRHLRKFAKIEVITAVEEAVRLHNPDAKEALSSYFEEVKATVIRASDYASLDSVMDRYFSSAPPFQASGKKKAEFPDAIALLALEGWAHANKQGVLCISKDGDWDLYCKQSDRLIITPELENVLAALVMLRGDQLPERVRRATIEWLNSEDGKALVEQSVQSLLDDEFPIVEADSFCSWDEEFVELYPKPGSIQIDAENVAVISADDTLAVVSVQVDFVAKGTCSFSFSVRDSIDRDLVPVGHGRAISETAARADISIEIRIEDFAATAMSALSSDDVTDVTVKGPRLHFDFGTISPDYTGDGPD